MGAVVGIGLRLLPFILAGLVAWYTWWKADNWCNSACDEKAREVAVLQAHAAELEGVIKVAQERATALALLWADAVQKVEVRYVEVVKQRQSVFASIRERSGRIRTAAAGIAVPVPADAAGVLADASRAANAASDSGEHQGPAEAVPGAARDTTLDQWVEAWTDAAEAYADAKEKHSACVAYVGQIHQKLEEAWPSQ
jgi:head-tail adaptor